MTVDILTPNNVENQNSKESVKSSMFYLVMDDDMVLGLEALEGVAARAFMSMGCEYKELPILHPEIWHFLKTFEDLKHKNDMCHGGGTCPQCVHLGLAQPGEPPRIPDHMLNRVHRKLDVKDGDTI